MGAAGMCISDERRNRASECCQSDGCHKRPAVHIRLVLVCSTDISASFTHSELQ